MQYIIHAIVLEKNVEVRSVIFLYWFLKVKMLFNRLYAVM